MASTATIPYSVSKDIPLIHEAEVIVVGGGPGGIGAAVMAAREGARTILIERHGYLGGMASARGRTSCCSTGFAGTWCTSTRRV